MTNLWHFEEIIKHAQYCNQIAMFTIWTKDPSDCLKFVRFQKAYQANDQQSDGIYHRAVVGKHGPLSYTLIPEQ